MRRFQLQRDEDASGVSGTGVVAQGVEFDDGHCALRWLTEKSSTGLYASADDLIAIHGHEGRTVLLWLDDLPYTGPGIPLPPGGVQMNFAPGHDGALPGSLGRRAEIIAKLRRAHP